MSASSTAFAGLWSSLPISLTDWILDVIQSMGHTRMTPVQASTIPLFMKHKDVVVEAVTGSGKTLAFVIPILERLIRRETRLKNREVGALIISPTRELAHQIHSIFSLFLASQPENENPYPPALLLVSSEQSPPAQDLERFLSTGADIVIGTPGRIEEFLLGQGRNTVDMKGLEVLVLDEADRLLDLGFQAVLSRIITHLPKQRRTGLFSATMTDADALSELVRVGLRNPARITVKVQSKKKRAGPEAGAMSELIEERRIPANLQNNYIACRSSEKLLQLTRLISHEASQMKSSHFIVYFATCACVDYFYKILPTLTPVKAKFYSLHGNLTPSARTKTLQAFSSAIPSPEFPSILLATDVAARGLDLPTVDVVIQFDPPTDTKTFSHRCGRTARAGRDGRAWVLLSGREIDFCDFLSIRKIPIKEKPPFTANGKAVTETGILPEDPEVEVFLRRIRELLVKDRAHHDQSIKAFVSFIRAYSKHEAAYIFRIKDLDMIALAKSFGLLRLPKMPELKNADRTSWQDMDISWDTFTYADPAQEAKRLAALAESAASKANRLSDGPSVERKRKKKTEAWSEQNDKKEEKEKRREKRKMKKKWLKSQIDTSQDSNQGKATGKRRREEETDASNSEDAADDWADLKREEKMAKKVRQGVLSQQEFDTEFMDLRAV